MEDERGGEVTSQKAKNFQFAALLMLSLLLRGKRALDFAAASISDFTSSCFVLYN